VKPKKPLPNGEETKFSKVAVPKHFYRQSAVIPYRLRKGRIEVLLISSSKRKRWVVPKGVKELDLSSTESAAKEALEEAGIEGVIKKPAIGSYRYHKWQGVCKVKVFLMLVTTEHKEWVEDYRDREWVDLSEAAARVKEAKLKRLIGKVPEHIV
jgi:phosphohistidine phosphatase